MAHGPADDEQIGAATRILIVDDEPAILSFYSSILDLEGYQVDTAEDGMAGWQALQNQDYDLLITDQSMPGLSGGELFQKTRQMKTPPPVILATGTFPVNKEALPFDAVLVKPFYAGDLTMAVNRVLSQMVPLVKYPANTSRG